MRVSVGIEHAKELILLRIKFKEDQIKQRKRQLDAGKFEAITSLIELEIRTLHGDVEFLKSILLELEN